MKIGFSILLLPKTGKMGGFCEVATKEIVQNTNPIFMVGAPCRKSIF
jgi:hypothetical protein